MNTIWLRIIVFLSLIGIHSSIASAQQTKPSFTVADEIGLTHFGAPYTGHAEAVQFSPDGNYFAVYTERGRLDLNCIEDSLRFYRTQEVMNFLEYSDESDRPSPVWVVNLSTAKKGPIVKDWRWLGDSTGIAFLESTVAQNERLVLADLQKKMIEPLTSATETVKSFDIRDRQHYVYTIVDSAERKRMQDERYATVIVGTGRYLDQLLFPDDPKLISVLLRRCYLWAVVGSKRFQVKQDDGVPIVLYGGALALSHDGESLVTTLPVFNVPSSWETLYPPPFASSPYRIRAGHHNLQSDSDSVYQYVRIRLQTSAVEALTEAPTSNDAGWWSLGNPRWSSDDQEIVLPGTFLKSKENTPSRPCVVVVDLVTNARTCVEMLKGHTETGVEKGYHIIKDSRFVLGDKQHVIVSYYDHQGSSIESTVYERTNDGTWQVTERTKDEPDSLNNGLQVAVKQGLNDPPRLVAADKRTSRVIWDPNPQLNNIELGEASVYKWKDKEGQEWRGGLFKPPNYKAGQRYPLVIQTHGFSESAFLPSGLYPTAFAARALAATGIVVLQVSDEQVCATSTVYEGPCVVSGYEVAAKQLVSEGLVDLEKIGIIGFSRTCFYVMQTLTNSSVHFKAASITDGVMESYLQYMAGIGGGDEIAHEANAMIGAKPFSEGLQQWLKRSPSFNLDKVTTPLLVVGEGPASVLFMWEPYAGLRYLQKPVDLIMLNTDEHVLTNPAVRIASQGGSVDWFRFWLQGYEDPAPTKAEQYSRWRDLRKLQETNEPNSTTPQTASK